MREQIKRTSASGKGKSSRENRYLVHGALWPSDLLTETFQGSGIDLPFQFRISKAMSGSNGREREREGEGEVGAEQEGAPWPPEQ